MAAFDDANELRDGEVAGAVRVEELEEFSGVHIADFARPDAQ